MRVKFLLLASTLFAASCGSDDSPVGPTGCELTPEQQLVDLINEARTQLGLPELVVDTRLAAAAQGHADDMAANDFFERIGSNGLDEVGRVEALGFEPTFLQENLGAGHINAQELFDDWEASPSHGAVLFAEPAVAIGVGHGFNRDSRFRDYWVATLGATDGALSTTPDGCHP